MTGPEHYREAERLLASVGTVDDPPAIAYNEMGRMAAAQVHATLALAAAYAMTNAGEMTVPDHDAWHDAASGAGPVLRIGGES